MVLYQGVGSEDHYVLDRHLRVVLHSRVVLHLVEEEVVVEVLPCLAWEEVEGVEEAFSDPCP